MALTLDLVTPEKTLSSQEVEMAVVPGMEGDFGVLEGHAALISSIRPGVIDVYNGGNISERIFVTGGFAEVTGERCTVLATEAFNLADVNLNDAQKRLDDATREHDHADNDIKKAKTAEKLKIAEALVETLS